MKRPFAFFILALSLTLSAETILDIDFTNDLVPIDHSNVGTCRGILP